MKTTSLIARLLLGLIFVVFGLNGFLHFIPMPPPTGVAGQFFGAIFASRYWVVIFGVQIIGGLLLLINRFVPLALATRSGGAELPRVGFEHDRLLRTVVDCQERLPVAGGRDLAARADDPEPVLVEVEHVGVG